ncbi:hypothetical protein BC829DRAFT_416958 [Chytridium lagenaria]|nr:hypothetical protein BC829DRAFT_416958 [Chytridium lagenaria]
MLSTGVVRVEGSRSPGAVYHEGAPHPHKFHFSMLFPLYITHSRYFSGSSLSPPSIPPPPSSSYSNPPTHAPGHPSHHPPSPPPSPPPPLPTPPRPPSHPYDPPHHYPDPYYPYPPTHYPPQPYYHPPPSHTYSSVTHLNLITRLIIRTLTRLINLIIGRRRMNLIVGIRSWRWTWGGHLDAHPVVTPKMEREESLKQED